MEEIKEFFKDVKRIADGIEAIANIKNEGEIKTADETACNCLTAQYEQSKQEQQSVSSTGTTTCTNASTTTSATDASSNGYTSFKCGTVIHARAISSCDGTSS